MNQKRFTSIRIIGIILALVGMFALGFGTANSMNGGWLGEQILAWHYGSGSSGNTANFSLFWNVWNDVHQKYAGKINDQQLVYGAISGMVNGLGDPYTVFMNPSDAKQFSQDIQGQFYGIGVEIGVQNSTLVVISPLDGSPAQKAGIKAGDTIVKINGQDVSNMTLDQAVAAIRGQKGTTVKLTILPKGASSTSDVSIVRGLIEVKSVNWSIKNGNIGYVRISQFSDDTVSLMQQALNSFKKQNVKGVILDLRDNPGGYLTGAQDVASMFISKGIVVSEKDKQGQVTSLFATGNVILPQTPLVVLVNGGSASAAEIVSGAIQDDKRGTLVGEKTFGKGSVQDVLDLVGGSSLKVTIAHWLTPKGHMIDKKGIEPDVIVPLSSADAAAGKDPQLDKAISILNGQK